MNEAASAEDGAEARTRALRLLNLEARGRPSPPAPGSRPASLLLPNCVHSSWGLWAGPPALSPSLETLAPGEPAQATPTGKGAPRARAQHRPDGMWRGRQGHRRDAGPRHPPVTTRPGCYPRLQLGSRRPGEVRQQVHGTGHPHGTSGLLDCPRGPHGSGPWP